jgi:exonuclease III
MKYMFWNTNRLTDVNAILSNIIIDLKCDVVGLAEYGDNIDDLIKSLSKMGSHYYKVKQIACNRIIIITKFIPSKVDHFGENTYHTIKKVPHDKLGHLLIGFAHFPSKREAGDYDRLDESMKLISNIKEAEFKENNQQTIIVGDFNMNPYDDPMVAAMSIHSTASRLIAEKKTRIVRRTEYEMFYNPMWNLMGDSIEPPGTYFYRKSEQVNEPWNMFDQILLRPGLVERFNFAELKILKELNRIMFVGKNGLPNMSDHLPIYFEIN